MARELTENASTGPGTRPRRAAGPAIDEIENLRIDGTSFRLLVCSTQRATANRREMRQPIRAKRSGRRLVLASRLFGCARCRPKHIEDRETHHGGHGPLSVDIPGCPQLRGHGPRERIAARRYRFLIEERQSAAGLPAPSSLPAQTLWSIYPTVPPRLHNPICMKIYFPSGSLS